MEKLKRGETFDDVWQQVSKGFEQIFQLQNISPTEYMKLYGVVFDYCTTSNSNPISQRILRGATTQPVSRNRRLNVNEGAKLNGEELYCRIKNYLEVHLEGIFQKGVDLQGESLLRFYVDNWERYRFSSEVANGFCRYLNRHWVRLEYDLGRKDVYEIYTMAIDVWRSVLFQPMHQQVTSACLQLIKSQRQNEIIDTRLIRGAIESYVKLGLINIAFVPANNEKIMPRSLAVYKECFEISFLEETETYYRLKAADIVRYSGTEYLNKVAQLFDEEVHRAQSYLHSSTVEVLESKIEKIFLMDAVRTLAKSLVSDENITDLAVLSRLLSRAPNANAVLRKILEEHIHKNGIDAITRVSSTAINDPLLYVETIAEVYTKFYKFLQEAFNSGQGFTLAFDDACRRFINDNAVTRAAGNTSKSSELLAQYCNTLLQKGKKNITDEDFEEQSDRIMVVFAYVADKDVFAKLYRNMLAKRLLFQLSASDDSERSMIRKLTQVDGSLYTCELRTMFQDCVLSKILSDEYRASCESNKLHDNFDFCVMVLSSNAWPVSAPPNIVLPDELNVKYDMFTKFYIEQHKNRKLTWVDQHSQGDLQTLYTKPKYILRVSTYQMAVLLLFNKLDRWTVEGIQEETQIKIILLLQVLYSLLKIKLIKCPEIITDLSEDNFKETDIKPDYHIQIDEDFKSEKLRVNLNLPSKALKQSQIESLTHNLDRDREMVIQTAIIRIMKVRITLNHASLMQEVIQQLSSRFQPKIPLIKKCIDALIEKEYLELDFILDSVVMLSAMSEEKQLVVFTKDDRDQIATIVRELQPNEDSIAFRELSQTINVATGMLPQKVIPTVLQLCAA
ncbi:unnamed protein product [Rotaria magnacalcarata]|uniref:Cullin family profile domain-containing protein n=1 Tax=Rotaria magnacalcarata TaxID=392030 RepID=A0A819IEG8_9BILA|nr:unnamed protein product [Rotaria magnacalcarata]CAF3911657.1 unnamed protein product [Rotaria magnacalcarata]